MSNRPSPRWALFERFDIVHDGELYLRRWRIFECPLFGIYLHRIARHDLGRDLHDHPWPFVSIVLRGRYYEEVPSPENGLRRGAYREVRWWNRKRASDAHRIDDVMVSKKYARHQEKGPCWTLVLRGKRVRDWGFVTHSGWVKAEDYFGEGAP